MAMDEMERMRINQAVPVKILGLDLIFFYCIQKNPLIELSKTISLLNRCFQ
jgi:hypothetical protein